MSDMLRITGMVTGMDTDEMVRNLLSLEQTKLDRVRQDKQYSVWQQEAYRDITNVLRDFKDEYFDFLNSDTNMRSSTTLNSYSVTFNGTESSEYLDITATRESTFQNYPITDIITAKSAEVIGNKLAETIQGNNISDYSIIGSPDHDKIRVTLNGVSKEIVMDNTSTNLDELRLDLSSKIDTAFGVNADGSKKITVEADAIDGSIRFLTDKTNSLSINNAYNDGLEEIFGQDLSAGLTIDEGNNKFELTLKDASDGSQSTHSFELNTGSNLSIDTIIADMQSKIDTAFGSGKLNVVNENNQIKLEPTSSDYSLLANKVENQGLAALGFTEDNNTSNKIGLENNLVDTGKHFNTDFLGTDTDADGYDIEFSINGELFEFDSAISSLKDIIDEVNSNEKANVTMKYDELNDNITVKANDTGVTSGLATNDVDGNIMQVLGINNIDEKGSDAVVTFDDGTVEGLTIVRSTNSFTVDGLNFELKNDISNTSIDMKINTDSTESLETIKGFVEKYNEVVTKLNEEYTEERNREYKPLTEAQKEELSEKEIELWEEKAKSGLLRSDSTLERVLYGMRSTLFQEVEGAGISLYEIGITTSSDYSDGGKLVIDEDKLKAALNDKPEAVNKLFTQQGDTDQAKGLSHRLYDIIQDNIRTTRDSSGRKGVLLEKAGIEGDVSEFRNILSDKMDDYDERIDDLLDIISDKEENYYNMFARMEAAINKMNNQSSWLMNQMGMGGTS